MNITRENIDDLNALLKVDVVKDDYEEKVENVLRDYRKKANIKGFRPGMVPIGLIRKMYGKTVRIEEINKTVSENINKYLTDEKLEILGDPLPKSDDPEHLDFINRDDFTFTFELGLAPEFEISINKKNKVTFYEIAVDEKMRSGYIDNYARRFGEFKNVAITEEKDILKGKVEKADDEGNPVPGGLSAEDAKLSVDLIKDEKIKTEFIARKINDTVVFDIKKAFPNDYEVAGLLNRKKEEAAAINGNFRFTIGEISRFQPAEPGQDLYNKIYGEGIVKGEEEFMTKITEEISANLNRESEFKLLQDIKELVIEKTRFNMPEEFLKKWLLRVNEKATAEQIDEEFEHFKHDLRWQLIRNKVAGDNDIKITPEELTAEAERITRYQFREYGLYYATDEQIANYAKETLKREEDAKRIADKILEDKVLISLKELVKVDTKSVSAEEFNKLVE